MKENLNLNTVFTNIANAIREKTNTSDLIKPNDMAEKINNIRLNNVNIIEKYEMKLKKDKPL